MSYFHGFREKRLHNLELITQDDELKIDYKEDTCWCQSLKLNRVCIIYDDQSLKTFHHLFGHPLLQSILFADKHFFIIDTYSLAMTYCYFLRCKLSFEQYTPINFLASLYLALDVEDDAHHGRAVILNLLKRGKPRAPPALLRNFNQIKVVLWKQMQYRAIVSSKTCRQIIGMMPDHPVWRRVREDWTYPTKKITRETIQRLGRFIQSQQSED